MGVEDTYSCLIDNQDFVVFQLDTQGIFTYVSPAIEPSAGYAPEDCIGQIFTRFVCPEDIPALEASVQEALAGRPKLNEFRAFHKNGSVMWVRASSRPYYEQGKLMGVLGIMTDITERKLAQEALRVSEDRYRDLAENSQDLLCTHDLQGNLFWVNASAARSLGYSVEEMLQIPMRELIAPEFQYQLDAYMSQIERHRVTKGLLAVRTRTGELKIWEYHNTLRTEGVSIPIVRGMARDVTDRIAAERALRKSEERFRVALKASAIKVFNQDRELRYTWVHNLPPGLTERDYLGKTDEEIFAPDDAAAMTSLKRRVLEERRGLREEITITFHNTKYYCDLMIEPLTDSAGNVVGITCACVDITELREKTEQLRALTNKLAEEKVYLEDEIRAEHNFEEIIGESSAIKKVLSEARIVAATDSTVLILGETGTGKELVARAIHRMSPRRQNTFVKLNCSAIPTGLLESELFGHEKGAFTGAISQKIGRLELADKGTLFLDEVGDLSRELQPKLLRVLQDQEFERLGSTRTLHVNVRLIAATNRDLAKGVAEKQFRSDLFYRLNVFPIRMPALHERREDIPVLVRHFVRKYAGRMNKQIESVPSETITALTEYDWPGNVRELENFVERSVILSDGPVLRVPLAELELEPQMDSGYNTLEAAEREYIVRILRQCKGVVAGPSGAAAKLGLNRTTLQSKMQRLGITRSDYEGKMLEDDSAAY